MKFDPQNPLPEVDVESVEYESLKSHAEQMDQWLGYHLEEVESIVRSEATKSPGREYWIGKSVQTFSTPYLDVLHALRRAKVDSNDVVVDLGCGFGRVGAVLALQFPGTAFVGIETIRDRIEEAQRVLSQFENFRLKLYHADLRTFDVEQATVDGKSGTLFFIYDFGSHEDFEYVFQSLRLYAQKNAITVIARGGRSRDFIQKTEHWLCQVHPPQHFARFSIYRS